MQVNFKRDFFHSQARYRSRYNPVEVPDHLKDELPADAEIVGEKPKKLKKLKKPKAALKEKAASKEKA